MVKCIGLAIVVLLLSVSGQSFREETATGEELAAIAGTEIGPLTMVTSSVSRGLASLRSQHGEFNTGEERRAEIGRAADEIFDVEEIARRALGQHWKGLLPLEQHEFVRLFRAVLAQSFVMIVQRYTGDHVASMERRLPEHSRRYIPASRPTEARTPRSCTACPGAARSGPSTTSCSTA